LSGSSGLGSCHASCSSQSLQQEQPSLIPPRGRKHNTHSAPKTNAEVTNPSSLKAVYPTKKKSLCSRADKDMEELPGKGTEDHIR